MSEPRDVQNLGREERRILLDEMTQQARSAGLYDVEASTYSTALARARDV